MLIRFWDDSGITFTRGLNKNLVTVLYFSIINVLCGAGGDASFAPQSNLVKDYSVALSFMLCIRRGGGGGYTFYAWITVFWQI